LTLIACQQGNYTFTNVTFYDEMMPIYFVYETIVEIKVVGRVKGMKSNVWLGSGYLRIELQPNDHTIKFTNTTEELERLFSVTNRNFMKSKIPVNSLGGRF
jgi:hypothetical protein